MDTFCTTEEKDAGKTWIEEIQKLMSAKELKVSRTTGKKQN